jgi:hypothetical protein
MERGGGGEEDEGAVGCGLTAAGRRVKAGGEGRPWEEGDKKGSRSREGRPGGEEGEGKVERGGAASRAEPSRAAGTLSGPPPRGGRVHVTDSWTSTRRGPRSQGSAPTTFLRDAGW